jgi:hypothetical protein
MAGFVERYSAHPLGERLGIPIAILMLLVFVGVGIDMIIHPSRYRKGYPRSCGAMIREWNDIGTRIFGFVFACFACAMLIARARSVWANG